MEFLETFSHLNLCKRVIVQMGEVAALGGGRFRAAPAGMPIRADG